MEVKVKQTYEATIDDLRNSLSKSLELEKKILDIAVSSIEPQKKVREIVMSIVRKKVNVVTNTG